MLGTKCRKEENALGPECSHLADPIHPYLDEKIVFTMPTAGAQVRCQVNLNFVGTRIIKMYMLLFFYILKWNSNYKLALVKQNRK